MDYYSSQISKLIEELSRLPGIGAKSAGRLAFHIINMPKEQVEQLAATLVDARNNVRYCKQCCTLTDKELCPICASEERDHKTIMVVENTRDLAASTFVAISASWNCVFCCAAMERPNCFLSFT